MMIDGKELIVSAATFEDAMALKEAIARALKENGIRIDLSSIDFDPENWEKAKVGEVGWVAEPILTVMTDSNIRKHLFECAKRALFDKNKVTPDFFDDLKNRRYYYPIMLEVVRVNLAPFFDLVSSLLSSLPGLNDYFQKLKSKPPRST